jgi:hypothetical protein
MADYLSIEQANAYLAGIGVEGLSGETLGAYLADLDALLEEWLRWRPKRTTYTEEVVSNRRGKVVLPRRPVIEIKLVERIPRVYSGQPAPSPKQSISYWKEGEHIICTRFREESFKVTWDAGLDPLPRIFTSAAWQVLRSTIEQGDIGNFSLLGKPIKEVRRVRLLGNVETEYHQATTAKPSDWTMLDEILHPMLGRRYRRNFIV